MTDQMVQIVDGEVVPMTAEEIAARQADIAAAAIPDVPESVTRLQGRLQLSRAGLLDKAEAAITAAGGEVAIWYADAQTWRRDDPHIAAIGAALALPSDQVDALFIAAKAIT